MPNSDQLDCLGCALGKLENGEQRPAPETYRARAEIPKITGQRLASASVTRGNVAGSHTPGNIIPETRLPGWGTGIRTKINGVRVRCSGKLRPIDSVTIATASPE